jgi:hypothetical protein
VPAGSLWVFAIATVYFVYFWSAGGFSRTEYPGPPSPLASGSPPWMTNGPRAGSVETRWNVSPL